MKTRIHSASNTLLAGLPLIAVLMLLQPVIAGAADAYKEQAGSPAGTFEIDPVHSSVQFWIGHLGVSELPGRFDNVSGNFSVNSARPDQVKISVQVPIDSLDTNFAQRNKDLLGPDFFNAKQFPAMTFTGTKLQWTGKNDGLLTGNLTLHGITRPVTFNRPRAVPDDRVSCNSRSRLTVISSFERRFNSRATITCSWLLSSNCCASALRNSGDFCVAPC